MDSPARLVSACLIHVTGLVQGIGFRPYIFRLAAAHSLVGWVENRADGVWIWVQGDAPDLTAFCKALPREAPVLSNIIAITPETVPPDQTVTRFSIRHSPESHANTTRISPDLAVCPDCLTDLATQPHRREYALVNCFNCGPRFSIIHAVPYDRSRTTMAEFQMCPVCQSEYDDPLSRRFHAQPNCCVRCGPEMALVYPTGECCTAGFWPEIAALLENQGILALKSIGGFHLACDAGSEEAVRLLRERKHRDQKPLAVMFRDLTVLAEYAVIDDAERALLTSVKAPIVLVKSRSQASPKLASAISRGLPTVGAFLPYTPLHHILFQYTRLDALVMTSGNISDDPMITDNQTAHRQLAGIADAIVWHPRQIQHRVDDSVAFVSDNQTRLIRRSRGYVPEPIPLGTEVNGIFATGGELKNAFALGVGSEAILSPHIGDLVNQQTQTAFHTLRMDMERVFQVTPRYLVHDLHPHYAATRWARTQPLPALGIQHHYAHIAAVMAEYQLTGPVIGVALDGTGYGTDGAIWGSEFLMCRWDGFDRISHLDYVPLPGGDRAIHEPWRMALAYLVHTYGPDIPELPTLQSIPSARRDLLKQGIQKQIQTVPTSSMGRLCDAVSALIGVCPFSGFEAEAAIRLEAGIQPDIRGAYPWARKEDGTIDVTPMIRAIVDTLRHPDKSYIPEIATRFHRTLVEIVIAQVQLMRDNSGVSSVALAGGVFQNRFLLKWISRGLRENGFHVFIPQQAPLGDGGIALGQLAIAGHRHI